jgi:hypothetical protein
VKRTALVDNLAITRLRRHWWKAPDNNRATNVARRLKVAVSCRSNIGTVGEGGSDERIDRAQLRLDKPVQSCGKNRSILADVNNIMTRPQLHEWMEPRRYHGFRALNIP